jgi:WD40 repeat protein
MTISNQTVITYYNGNGSTTNFAISSAFQDNSEIKVYLLSALGVESLKVLSTDYTLSGGNPATTVVMVTPPAVGEKLVIKRDTAKTQTADYLSNSKFPAETHEEALDKIVQMVQELNYDLSRTIKVKIVDTGSLSMEYPVATDRANKYAAYDGDGKPIAVAATISPGSTTPYIDTLLDDTTAAEARTTLGFTGAGATAATANIENNAITDVKLRDSAAVSVIGRSANSSGDPADIVASANDNVLKREGDALVFGKVKTADIQDAAITASKLDTATSGVLVGVRNTFDFSGNMGQFEMIPQWPWSAPNKLTDPATLPTGNGTKCAWSPCGEFLAVPHTTTPFITIYQRSGTTFIKLANPATLPAGNATSACWSRNGEFLVVGHATSPFITIYQRSGKTFTKLTNPATLPAGTANGVAFSPNGEFLAVAHATSTFLTIYQRSGTTFTSIPPIWTAPAGTGNGVAWSADSRFLSVAHVTSPFITIYERSDTTFTKLTNPADLPTNAGQDCSFSPSGEFLTVAHVTTPFITTYQRSGTTFTKLANPSSLPASNGAAVAWSLSNKYLAIGHGTSPFLSVYERSGTTFTKLANVSTIPNGFGGCDFSPNGEFLAVASNGSPNIQIYQTNSDMPSSGFLLINGIAKGML